MKLLAIEKETKNIDLKEKSEILMDEAKIVFELYKKDIIREIYFNEKHCAVIILECESIEQSKEILNLLPLVQKEYITFEIMELKPYTGLDRLSE
jgi:hypothetical protein